MQKDFDSWNKIKKSLNDHDRNVFCYAREIWLCSIGANIGNEADGKSSYFSRPVLVYKVISARMFWGIPLTSKSHVGKAYVAFNLGGIDNTANLTQMRPMSMQRLGRKITVMPENLFKEIKTKVLRILS